MINILSKLIKSTKRKFHRHSYTKPIVSKYVSFSSRNIIYQCKCGHRKSTKIFRIFGEEFPIETSTFLDDDEFERILNGSDVEETLQGKYNKYVENEKIKHKS